MNPDLKNVVYLNNPRENLVPSNRGKEMGEADKFDRDLQIHLDEKTNDLPATEMLPENPGTACNQSGFAWKII